MKMNSIAIKIPRPGLLLGFLMVIIGCQPEKSGPQFVIETGQIEEVGPTHSIIHGEIYEIGMDEITQHGFVWSESSNPTLQSGNLVQLGRAPLPGTYSTTLKELSPNTTYYFKAFATAGEQSAYGLEKSFTTTSPTVPTLYTFQAYEIGPYSAVTGGITISDGGSEITSRGICWSTTPAPTLNNNYTIDGAGAGSFESELSGLEPYTVYFIRAYATNSLGTGYGETFGLVTLWDNSPVEDIDGNEYGTVQLGDQVWMSENFKSVHFANGDPLPRVETAEEWVALNKDAKACSFYENSDSAFETYGALYTWSAAMDGGSGSAEITIGPQGVCPDGWHLPAESEWRELEYYLGMNELQIRDEGWRGWSEGGMLKQEGTILWVEPNYLATNETGFTALPGGYRDSDGLFQAEGFFAGYWSSTGDQTNVWIRGLHTGHGEILREEAPRSSGYSVRCVMDR